MGDEPPGRRRITLAVWREGAHRERVDVELPRSEDLDVFISIRPGARAARVAEVLRFAARMLEGGGTKRVEATPPDGVPGGRPRFGGWKNDGPPPGVVRLSDYRKDGDDEDG